MSNIIKSVCINPSITERRIINGNEAAREGNIEKQEIDVPDINPDFEDRTVRDINKGLKEREQELRHKEKILNEKADEIIRQAGESAQKVLTSARKQADSIKAQAEEEGRNQGYSEGYRQGEAQVEQLKLELEEEFDEQKRLFKEQTQKFETEFVDLASSVIEKITGVVMKDKTDVILHLINRALDNCENSKNYVIRVSKEDFDFVNGRKSSILEQLKEGVTVEISETDNFTKNKCIIETDNNVIDCSLDSQLTNLIEDLKILSMQ